VHPLFAFRPNDCRVQGFEIMRALLDVNVLTALLDSDHTSHGVALMWFATHAGEGWASSPITQNGCIRIMSNLSYPNALPVQAVMKRLADACEDNVHEFWSDEVSLLNPNVVDSTRIHGPRQLTDIYLLALAVEQEGRLVTFDTGVPLAVVRKATPDNLVVL
jgi:toxin-antitoxin system PIN domain toxin